MFVFRLLSRDVRLLVTICWLKLRDISPSSFIYHSCVPKGFYTIYQPGFGHPHLNDQTLTNKFIRLKSFTHQISKITRASRNRTLTHCEGLDSCGGRVGPEWTWAHSKFSVPIQEYWWFSSFASFYLHKWVLTAKYQCVLKKVYIQRSSGVLTSKKKCHTRWWYIWLLIVDILCTRCLPAFYRNEIRLNTHRQQRHKRFWRRYTKFAAVWPNFCAHSRFFVPHQK